MTKFRKLTILTLCLTLGSLLLPGVNGTRGKSATPDRTADEEQIKQLERDRQDAFVRNDIDALDRDTANDYTTINGTGKLSTKPQMMQNLRQAKTKVISVKLSDMKTRIYGDTAVLTGDYRDVNVREGVQRETHALFMRIFVKNNGHWQAVAYQQTPVLNQ
jgi:Domain of unknown function (DUF4440)